MQKSEDFYKNYLKIYKADRLLTVHINGFNNEGIKLFRRLHLGLSHLYDDKFKHSFLDSLSPICSCGWILTQFFIIYSIAPVSEMKEHSI